MTFEQTLQSQSTMLLEEAVIERLRRSQPELLHPQLLIAPLVQSAQGRAALSKIYREYIVLAAKAGLPIVLATPTWRADRDRCRGENSTIDFNGDAAAFINGFKKEYANLFTAGQIGCRNDCYKPEEALSPEEAFDFHAWQANRLTQADFLYGVTLPETGEALGMARAMAETGLPYIISFVIGKDGRILDGTVLEEAIGKIDSQTKRPPAGYGVNCCYPSFLRAAGLSARAAQRMLTIQANASSLTHAELEAAETVEADPIEDWSKHMLDLRRHLGIRILGGCCGTTVEHLKALV